MLIRLAREYLRPYKTWIWVIVALQLVGTIASLYLPSLNADIIDNGVVRGDTDYIIQVGIWMLAVSLVQVICSIAAVYFGARTAMGFGRDLRSAIFSRVASFSSREVAGFGAPSLITRNTNDVQQVQMLTLMTFTMMVMAPIMAVGGVIMALRQDVGLAWLVAVAVPVLGVIVGLIISRMVPAYRKMQERIDTVNRVLREQITGIRVLRAFVREPLERERFGRANVELTDVSLTVGRWMAAMFPVVMLVLNVSSVAVLWFGGIRVDQGLMEIGSLTAFLAYLVQILMSVMMATFMLVMVPRAAVSADRIGEVLDTRSSVVPPEHGVTELTRRGDLELRGVEYSYPGAAHPVLHDVSFTARPGQTTAIIGSTGAGRRTLLNLIPRLFDATGGSVLVDGVDIRDIDPESLWARIGLVPQKPYPLLGHRGLQPPIRKSRCDRGRDVGRARDRSGGRFRQSHAGRAGRTRCPGGDQPLRRAASASCHRQGDHPSSRDLPVRRLVLGARPGDRRPAPSGAEADHRQLHSRDRGAAGLHHRRRRPDHRPRRR